MDKLHWKKCPLEVYLTPVPLCLVWLTPPGGTIVLHGGIAPLPPDYLGYQWQTSAHSWANKAPAAGMGSRQKLYLFCGHHSTGLASPPALIGMDLMVLLIALPLPDLLALLMLPQNNQNWLRLTSLPPCQCKPLPPHPPRKHPGLHRLHCYRELMPQLNLFASSG